MGAKKKTHVRTASGKPITDELVKELAERAEQDHETMSSVIRKALRRYLRAG